MHKFNHLECTLKVLAKRMFFSQDIGLSKSDRLSQIRQTKPVYLKNIFQDKAAFF
jgi:hypothetical protein